MKQPALLTLAATVLVVAGVSYAALVAAQEMVVEDHQRHGPPPAALEACRDASPGAMCRMATPGGELSGSCRRVPSGQLACVPEGARRPERSASGTALPDAHLRRHTTVQSDGPPTLYPATQAPIADSEFNVAIKGAQRYITANGIAEHNTGKFPNPDNPNRIGAQHYTDYIPSHPQMAQQVTPLELGMDFGIAVNGVPFDPGAAEFYRGDRRSGWQYEPLSGALLLGLDENHAHVQPTGAYHYHGLPTLLLEDLGIGVGGVAAGSVAVGDHSVQVGWAADGFPIYALYGYSAAGDASSPVVELTSSYRLKSGSRPAGAGDPGGFYDGTFTRDYEYVPGLGDLDECNGRYTVTPEFPQGTYAYFLTRGWPVIPRCFRGQPSRDFFHRPGQNRH